MSDKEFDKKRIDVENEIPNAETKAAIEELENGGGYSFSGSAEEFIVELSKEE